MLPVRDHSTAGQNAVNAAMRVIGLPLWVGLWFAGIVAQAGQAPDAAAAKAAFTQGRAAHDAGKTDEAVSHFERAVALEASNAIYQMWLGHAYSRQLSNASFFRQPFIARRSGAAYQKAVELDPSSAEIAQARFEFLLEAPGIVGGGVGKARAEAARLKTLDPYRGEMADAKVAEHEKQPAEAERIYRSLLTRFPDQTGALEPLLVLLMNAKRYDEGFALVDLRLVTRPDETMSLYSLGRLASVSGQHLARGESALRRFLEVAGSNPIPRANAHYRLGLIKEKLGDNGAAIAEYRAAIALSPRHSLAATALKNLERRQDDAS